MDDEADSDGDGIYDVFQDLSEREKTIYARRELLQIEYVPSDSRIVGRDDQIETVATRIGPAVVGKKPESFLIFGKTGVGKSLVAKRCITMASEEARSRGNNIATCYVNCRQSKGNADLLSKIGSNINVHDSSVSFPSRGISEGEYYDRLWRVLDVHYDAAVIVTDEVDTLKDDDVLMVLSRAGEDGSVDIPIGVVGISNKIDYRDNQMSQRTKSSFGHDDIIFDPYDAKQLRAILRKRADAFVEGVLASDVIPKAAAMAAKEHGDARKAMRLLRYAGDYAVEENADQVTTAHLEKGRSAAEVDRLLDLLSGLPPHTRYLVLALGHLTDRHSDQEWFRTREILEAYKQVCESEVVDPLSIDRVRDLLDELAFLQVTDTRRGKGDGRGNYVQHTLLWDAETVLKITES